MEEENLLIKKSIEGSQDAFARLVDIYKNYVFAIILNFIKDYGEVENVAQEVFLQIYISLSTYNNDNFKGWIGKIAANKSIDWIRRKRAKFSEESVENTTNLIDGVSLAKNNPEMSVVRKERKELLLKVINKMPEIYSTAIEKFYFQEKSYEMIAEEEGVTVKTIASRLYRAKILLKKKWREENETL